MANDQASAQNGCNGVVLPLIILGDIYLGVPIGHFDIPDSLDCYTPPIEKYHNLQP
jgi:hypothetical protein